MACPFVLMIDLFFNWIEQQEHHRLIFLFLLCWLMIFFPLFTASSFKVSCGYLAILFLPRSITHFFENIRVDVPTCLNFSLLQQNHSLPNRNMVFRKVFDSIRIILFLFCPQNYGIYTFKLFYFKCPHPATWTQLNLFYDSTRLL